MSEDIRLQSVTVEVPAERVAEFHQLFGRFLAGDVRRGRGPRGRHHRGRHGHGPGPGCAGRHEHGPGEPSEVAEA